MSGPNRSGDRPQGIRTPDGATLRDGMCDCAVHCSNHCEATHCPPGTPWCRCWCHSDRYLAIQEDAKSHGLDEYDPATCQTAGELRAAGMQIPATIPDCAWIPVGSMVVVGEPKVTAKAPNLLTVQGLRVMFTVPFRWIEVEGTVTVSEGT